MAGLGTAGVLVLAASMLFTLASAVVAFNGWPTLGGGGAPATQLVIARAGSASHARRRATAIQASAVTVIAPAHRTSTRAILAASRAITHVTAIHPVGTGTATGRLSDPVSPTGTINTTPVTKRSPAPTHTTSGSTTPAPTTTTPATPVSGTAATVVGTVVKATAPVVATAASAPSKVVTTASNAGSATASTVSKVVGSIGKPALNVASNAASTISSTATAVTSTATSTTGTASTVVSSAGSPTKSTARSGGEGADALVGALQTTLHQLLSGL
jgi:hypothetical protein